MYSKNKRNRKKYTFASRGGDNGKVNLPVVYYNVDGKEYKVIGTEYKAFKILTKKSLTGENTIECKEENQVLTITGTANSFINVYKNPIDELYPIGTNIDVFYDPKKPKEAYVLRYCNRKWAFYLMFFCGLGILILGFIIMLVV